MKGKIKIFAKNLLLDLRKSRKSKFLFLPEYLSFKDICINIYYEYVDTHKSDMCVINKFIGELVNLGLLINKPVEYFYYTCEDVTFHDVYIWTSEGGRFCRGTSTDIAEAYAKAVGEVFERTSIRYPVVSKIYHGSEIDLNLKGLPHVKITDFPQPTKEQLEKFSNFRINALDSFSWINVLNIKNKNSYLVPAQTVFYQNSSLYKGEKQIIQPSTHGAGAGYSYNHAVRSALCEVIHRHFFLKSWYSDQAPNKIKVDTIPKDTYISKLIMNLKKNDFNVNLLDYSSEANIPTIICIIEKNGGWAMGGSSSFLIETAIERSIGEAMATYFWRTQTVLKGGYSVNPQIVNEVKGGFLDSRYSEAYSRIMLYGSSFFLKQCSKNILSGNEISFSRAYDKEDNYDIEQHSIDSFGDVYLHLSEKKYLEKYNYKVVKVIIPQSFFFALDEIYSRPLLKESYPINMLINPFP